MLWFRNSDDWAALFVPVTMWLTGFLSFALYHDLGLLSAGSLISALLIIAIGLAIGLLLSALRSKLVRAAALGLILWIYLDLQFQIFRETKNALSFIESSSIRDAATVALMIGLIGALLLVRKHLSTILLVGFCVTLISVTLAPPKPIAHGPQRNDQIAVDGNDLPALVHIILDGHIGIDGIPSDIEGGPALRNDLLEFYVRNGFRVYGRTYSRYMQSVLSLSELLNRDRLKFNDWLTTEAKTHYSLIRNDYFDELTTRGYAIRVYESDYLVYCDTPNAQIESCYRATATSPQPVGGADLTSLNKARLILAGFFRQSSLYDSLAGAFDTAARFLNGIGVEWPVPRVVDMRMYSGLEAPAVHRELVSDIGASASGRAYFAHLLLPHEPYIFDRDCAIVADPNRWLGRRFSNHSAALGTNEYREAAYKLYFSQVRCVTVMMSQVFDALKEAGLWQDATIILHGDHGSRISLRDPISGHADQLTPQDMTDLFSALFAIRSPKTQPGFDPRTLAIQDLFSEYFFNRAPQPDEALVYTMGLNVESEFMAIPMVPIGPDLHAEKSGR